MVATQILPHFLLTPPLPFTICNNAMYLNFVWILWLSGHEFESWLCYLLAVQFFLILQFIIIKFYILLCHLYFNIKN